MAQFGFNLVSLAAADELATVDVYPHSGDGQVLINFDEDTRIEKLDNDDYIYLIKKEVVLRKTEKVTGDATVSRLATIDDPDERIRFRDRLLNRAPYTARALI